MRRLKLKQFLLEANEEDVPQNVGIPTPSNKPFKKMDVVRKSRILQLMKKMKNLFDKNIYSFDAFPEWVLQSWTTSTGLRALPLKATGWLDTKATSTSNEEEIYAGFMVDDSRSRISGGVVTISLNKSKVVDKKKFDRLKLYAYITNKIKLAKEREIQKKKLMGDLSAEANLPIGASQTPSAGGEGPGGASAGAGAGGGGDLSGLF